MLWLPRVGLPARFLDIGHGLGASSVDRILRRCRTRWGRRRVKIVRMMMGWTRRPAHSSGVTQISVARVVGHAFRPGGARFSVVDAVFELGEACFVGRGELAELVFVCDLRDEGLDFRDDGNHWIPNGERTPVGELLLRGQGGETPVRLDLRIPVARFGFEPGEPCPIRLIGALQGGILSRLAGGEILFAEQVDADDVSLAQLHFPAWVIKNRGLTDCRRAAGCTEFGRHGVVRITGFHGSHEQGQGNEGDRERNGVAFHDNNHGQIIDACNGPFIHTCATGEIPGRLPRGFCVARLQGAGLNDGSLAFVPRGAACDCGLPPAATAFPAAPDLAPARRAPKPHPRRTMPESFQIFPIDIVVFVLFVIAVVAVGMLMSRNEKGSEDYFLAGRGLKWWLIGFSLIAANISTEQFVGMSGNAASHVGMAIASYEWMAAITLIVVAFGFLPYFLRAGIFTMPEFLEYRYNGAARAIMAFATIFIYLLLLGAVTYSGALTISTLATSAGYHVGLFGASAIIGIIAMLYVTAGGLKACAWADLIQGSALIVGGAVIMYFAFDKLGSATEAAAVVSTQTGAVTMQTLSPDTGSLARFLELNRPRLNMFLPSSDSILPWTALLLGLWIPNFYYWGLNQYITQRTLGSASLAQGQRGIVFAAFMKLIIPFVIVIPGIIAFNLYSGNMRLEARADTASSLALYLKANPQTDFVSTQQGMTDEQVAAWPAGHYVIALYPDDAARNAVRTRNSYVLPMTQAAFDRLSPGPSRTFVSEDQAWRHVNEGLAAEIQAYNQKTEAEAQAAGQSVTVEKLIAYKYDTALAQLLGHVLPQGKGLVGFVLAALLGAVVSSLAAMLNAASTIFAMDIFKKHIARNAEQKTVVLLGRGAVVVFTIIAVLLAPKLGDPAISNSIFTIIQEAQGFISPGILAVFVFGLISHRAPAVCGVVGLVTNIIAYGVLKVAVPELQFLNRMAVCFALCIGVMAVLRMTRPLAQPIEFRANTTIALETSKGARAAGLLVVAATLVLYVVFSPWGIAG